MQNKTPLVSICMITYNHENYIREAIEGVLMQIVNFQYELIIGDDCSSDKTIDICFEYYNKYPNIIKLIKREKNVGIKDNFWQILNECKGKYIAFCEGDDYWIDSNKLSKQIEYLENNKDIGLIHTNCVSLKDNNFISDNKNKPIDGECFEFLLEHKFYISTLTVCFRRELLNNINKEYLLQDFKMQDYPLWLEISRITKIKYLNQITAVYRILNESASHSKNIYKQFSFNINTYKIKLYFIEKYIPNSNYKPIVNSIIINSTLTYYFKTKQYIHYYQYYKNNNCIYSYKVKIKYIIVLTIIVINRLRKLLLKLLNK